MRPQARGALSPVGPVIGQPRTSTSPASGPDATRPLPSRPPSGSHRRLVSSSARDWVFLTATAPANASPPRIVVRRPATARDKGTSALPGSSQETLQQRPRRPHTGRPRCSSASPVVSLAGIPSDSAGSVAGVSPAELARVVQEAAQRQVQQESYVDPLLERGVELRVDALLPRARATVASASNRKEQHRARALQAREQGDYHLAIRHFEKLVALSPCVGDSVFFHLAVAYERVGRLEDALATYQRVIASEEGNAFAHFNAGNMHMRLGKLRDAIGCYSKAIQHSHALSAQQQLAFYRQRGAAYRKSGEFERAARDYVWLRQEATGLTPRRGGDSRPRAECVEGQASDACRAKVLARAQAISKRVDAAKPDFESVLPRSGVARTSRRDYVSTAPDTSTPSADGQAVASPFDQWKRERMLEIVDKDPGGRSDDELHFLADCLQLRFPFCAALRHDVCVKMCSKVVAVELPTGAPVFYEHDRGRGHMYFVCLGRVSVSVTRVLPLSERPVSNQEERDGEEKATTRLLPPSWETSSSATSGGDDGLDLAPPIQPVTESWARTQMRLCDLGVDAELGRQGRHSNAPRSYSAVAASRVTLLALSWSDVLETEQAQRIEEQAVLSRFLRMTSLFGAASSSEIDQLSLCARPAKIIGSKVLCTEGQFVGGLLVAREGELCQLSPSGLPLPPDLSIAFNLCGSLHGQPHGQEQSALEFFTQLERADDPLGFLELSRAFHGFLPSRYLADRLAALRDLSAPAAQEPQATAPRVVARCIRRGEFFCASSSWVPFSRSTDGGRGVSCAKTALVSRESSEVLFFSARDLSEALSPETRMAVFKEVQSASTRIEEAPPSAATALSTARRRGPADAATTAFFLSDKRTSDLMEQARRDDAWAQFKQRLVQELAQDKAQRRQQRRCQSAR